MFHKIANGLECSPYKSNCKKYFKEGLLLFVLKVGTEDAEKISYKSKGRPEHSEVERKSLNPR